MENEFNCGGNECDDLRCDDCDVAFQFFKHSKENNIPIYLDIKMRDGDNIILLPGASLELRGGGGGGTTSKPDDKL